MQYRNEYAHLRREGRPTGTMRDGRTLEFCESANESITVLIGEFPGKRFAVGFTINYLNGARSQTLPGEKERFGWFQSRRDAEQWALGHLLQHREYFSEEAVKAIKMKLLGYIQNDLFT